jgi:hypothetical protein
MGATFIWLTAFVDPNLLFARVTPEKAINATAVNSDFFFV